MADFLQDTAIASIAGEPGCFRAELSPKWAVWGPNGGYVAAIALRAAMAGSRAARPASFHCHFLAVGDFAPVDVRVVSLGGGKRAESLRVEMIQQDKLLLTATVWMVADGLQGFAHDFGAAPQVPGPNALRGYQELAEEYDQWYPIWRSMEGRPIRWREGPGRPESQTWLRFTDTAIPDRQADALRQLFWLDFPGWNATIAAHEWPFRFLAPNLDRDGPIPPLRTPRDLDARRRRVLGRGGRVDRMRFAPVERRREATCDRHVEAHEPPQSAISAGIGARPCDGSDSSEGLRRAAARSLRTTSRRLERRVLLAKLTSTFSVATYT